jgi:hypothetical protein
MRLIETLRRGAAEERSLFRGQLLREDVARLEKLRQLARTSADLAAFKTAGLCIGWTQGDARTHEIRAPLERLLERVYAYETLGGGHEAERKLDEAWIELHRCRMERLIGCLSTPAPKPADGPEGAIDAREPSAGRGI